MIWNYRVTFRPSIGFPSYEIREVYYDDTGKVKLYSKDPIAARGDTVDEFYSDMCLMMDSLDKDPLNLDVLDRELEKNKA